MSDSRRLLGTGDDVPADALSLAGVLRQLIVRRTLVVRLVGFAMIATVGVGLLLPRTFTSTLAIVPQVQDSGASTGGIAAQLGITLRGFDLTQTPDFYAAFFRTRSFLRSVVEPPLYVHTARGDSVRVTMVDHYRITRSDTTWAREVAADALQERLRVGVDLKTGVISLSITDRDPEIALELARRSLALVNEYNNVKRQSQAAVERAFLESRVQEAKLDMRRTEDELLQFMETNRSYGTSATLVFEHDRIGRTLSLQRDLYYGLAQKLDQSRIEQVRNTPLLTVLEHPIRAPRPDRRYLLLKGLLAGLFAFFLAVLIIFAPLAVAYHRAADPVHMKELELALREFMRRTRSMFRRGR